MRFPINLAPLVRSAIGPALRVLAAAGAIAGADAHAALGLDNLSFEQLSAVEVSGVSRSTERVLDAPAAVSVVTSAEIRSFGFRTLADVLNAAPGFFTYSDRAYSYLGVRGFAPIEGYNARVLLLIDGFPANENFFQQALIGKEGLVDLDLIDRVEIIRGPSSSVYGNNALLGVINVILKSPSQLRSRGEAWTGAGGENGGSATVSGGSAGGLNYFLRLSGSGSRGQDVVFPSQPGIPGGTRVSGLDGTDMSRMFAKVVSGNLQVDLAFNARRQQAGYGLYGDVIGYPGSFVRDGETVANVRYEGNWSQHTDYSLRASVAEYRYDSAIFDPNPPSPQPLVNLLPIKGDWFDSEATVTHHLSAHSRLVAGINLRRDMRENMVESNPVDGVLLRVNSGGDYLGAYVQSDIDWSDRWATSVGVRDDEAEHENRANPRLALLYKPASDQVVKLMYGTAYRKASAFERFFSQPPSILPSPALAPERLRTLDLEYNAQPATATHVAVTIFHYQATNLITAVLVDSNLATTQLQNAESSKATGVDLSLEQDLTPRTRARISTSFVNATSADGDRSQNAPRWTGRLALEQRLGARWRLAAEALYATERIGIDNAPLPPFAVMNLTLASEPRPGSVDVALNIRNLFDRAYAQPVEGWQGDRVDEPGLGWLVTVGYTF